MTDQRDLDPIDPDERDPSFDPRLHAFLDGDLDYLAIGTFLAEGRNAKTRERLVTSASNVS